MLSSLLLCSCFVALLTVGSGSVDPYRTPNVQQQVDYNPYSALLALLLGGNFEPAETQYQRRYSQPGEFLIH
jgi:hypothetical protein